LGSIARRGRQPELPTFLYRGASELYQQSFYAKRCTAPRRAAILLRLDKPEFPASQTPPRDHFPARPLVPVATNSVVKREKRTVQTVCAADCTVSVCAADGLEWSERLEHSESLRLYEAFSFSLKDFIVADLQIPLFLLSNEGVSVPYRLFPTRLLRILNVIVCNTTVTHLSQKSA
jgi:hypothetical protein